MIGDGVAHAGLHRHAAAHHLHAVLRGLAGGPAELLVEVGGDEGAQIRDRVDLGLLSVLLDLGAEQCVIRTRLIFFPYSCQQLPLYPLMARPGVVRQPAGASP